MDWRRPPTLFRDLVGKVRAHGQPGLRGRVQRSLFMGSERLKLANEGAIRINIQQLIEALASLKLAAGEVQLVK